MGNGANVTEAYMRYLEYLTLKIKISVRVPIDPCSTRGTHLLAPYERGWVPRVTNNNVPRGALKVWMAVQYNTFLAHAKVGTTNLPFNVVLTNKHPLRLWT
jgi:hypothetical protein